MSTSRMGFTQIVFNYGPELGITASQKTYKDSRTVNYDYPVTRTWKPVVSPLVGLQGELKIKRHLLFKVGLQYQLTGNRFRYHREHKTIWLPYPGAYTYTTDEREEQTFHKLCLPITLGYEFRIRKIKPSIYIGYRPNLFLTGKYYYKLVHDASDNSRDLFIENKYNPLDPDQAGVPIKRIQKQVIAGFAATIRNRIKISLNYSSGRVIYYSEYEQMSWEHNYTYFLNDDYAISLTYFLRGNKDDQKK